MVLLFILLLLLLLMMMMIVMMLMMMVLMTMMMRITTTVKVITVMIIKLAMTVAMTIANLKLARGILHLKPVACCPNATQFPAAYAVHLYIVHGHVYCNARQ